MYDFVPQSVQLRAWIVLSLGVIICRRLITCMLESTFNCDIRYAIYHWVVHRTKRMQWVLSDVSQKHRSLVKAIGLWIPETGGH